MGLAGDAPACCCACAGLFKIHAARPLQCAPTSSIGERHASAHECKQAPAPAMRSVVGANSAPRPLSTRCRCCCGGGRGGHVRRDAGAEGGPCGGCAVVRRCVARVLSRKGGAGRRPGGGCGATQNAPPPHTWDRAQGTNIYTHVYIRIRTHIYIYLNAHTCPAGADAGGCTQGLRSRALRMHTCAAGAHARARGAGRPSGREVGGLHHGRGWQGHARPVAVRGVRPAAGAVGGRGLPGMDAPQPWESPSQLAVDVRAWLFHSSDEAMRGARSLHGQPLLCRAHARAPTHVHPRRGRRAPR